MVTGVVIHSASLISLIASVMLLCDAVSAISTLYAIPGNDYRLKCLERWEGSHDMSERSVYFKWFFNDLHLVPSDHPHIRLDEGNRTLVIDYATPHTEGQYRCECRYRVTRKKCLIENKAKNAVQRMSIVLHVSPTPPPKTTAFSFRRPPVSARTSPPPHHPTPTSNGGPQFWSIFLPMAAVTVFILSIMLGRIIYYKMNSRVVVAGKETIVIQKKHPAAAADNTSDKSLLFAFSIFKCRLISLITLIIRIKISQKIFAKKHIRHEWKVDREDGVVRWSLAPSFLLPVQVSCSCNNYHNNNNNIFFLRAHTLFP